MFTLSSVALLAIVNILMVRTGLLLFKIWSGNTILTARKKTLRTIICYGPGGHSTELMRIMKALHSEKYSPRLYMITQDDLNSRNKALKSEESLLKQDFSIVSIPRSRAVGQSFVTSFLTTLHSIFMSIYPVIKFKPDIIICNGPGTCIPVCLVAFILRILYLFDVRIIFIESFCRVRSLSLTGKILIFFADYFIVQWPSLLEICPRAKYFGRLA